MAVLTKFVRVVTRRQFDCDEAHGYLIPLLEPLFEIETHLIFEERMMLFSLASSLPEKFVACEIGSYCGASTSFLAAAASLKQGHVHAVDTWMNDAMPGERAEDTWERFLENVDRFRNWITPHRGRAGDVKEHVPRCDLLFIDGDHSYEATLENLSDYVPKLNKDGILAMHDFNHDVVRQAMHDYFKDRPIEDLGFTNVLQAFRPR